MLSSSSVLTAILSLSSESFLRTLVSYEQGIELSASFLFLIAFASFAVYFALAGEISVFYISIIVDASMETALQ